MSSPVKSERWEHGSLFYQALVNGTPPPDYLMLHANGFNGGAYLPFLQQLPAERSWAAPDFRGHGHSFQPLRISNWFEFVADVLAWADAGKIARPLAIGHSLGGIVALLTEAMRPDTFRGIVLLDPVAFAPRLAAALSMVQLPGLRRLHPMVRLTRRRRMGFPDKAAVIAAYSGKAAFRNWQPAFLQSYVEWGTLDVPGGVRLACDRRTEAQIFSTWPASFWKLVARVTCPVLIMRGAESLTFRPKAAASLCARLPNARLQVVPQTGHFLPMERPEAVIQAIAEWAHVLESRADTSPEPTRTHRPTANEVRNEDQ